MENLIKIAIDNLKRFEPKEGYFLAFSGGKDSICCYQLLKLSGCKFESHYSITTVDEPFVKPFIRKNYTDVIFDRPKLSMFQLIVKKGILPGRIARFCCEFLKEYSGKSRLVVTGIRNAESFNRSKRRLLEIDSRKQMQGKAYLNIICKWSENDVWEFIKKYKLIVPDYYANDCRSARGGCVGCPFSGVRTQRKDFIKYPRYKTAYLKAISKAMERGRFKQFENANDVFDWWLSDVSIVNYFESKKQTFINFEKI
jgi:phosphoadenosine phosphosulfate reductase